MSRCLCGVPYYADEGSCHDVCKNKRCDRLVEESGTYCSVCEDKFNEDDDESV